MEREDLQRWVAEGLSLDAIGRRVGRSPSTVSYWMAKHGLAPSGRERFAARGAIDRERLAALVDAGASIREIAAAVERSPGSVRHWLARYELETRGGMRRVRVREALSDGRRSLQLDCTRHGRTEFRYDGRAGFRCVKCRASRVIARRKAVKATLVAEAGGRCRLCGYNRCLAALQFHHVDPAQKSFGLSYRGEARSLDRARAEAQKCVLLCANCHAEVEAGVASVA